MRVQRILPQFKSTDEEAEFWKTHSAADFQEDLAPVEMVVEPDAERRSPRCPLDDQILLSRFVDLRLADGRVKLERLEELYCRQGHYARLAPEADQLVREIESTLKRIHLQAEKVAA